MCTARGQENDRHLYLGSARYELLLQAGLAASDPSSPSKS